MTLNRTLSKGIELVSHDVRADILVALARHQWETAGDGGLRFTNLRDQVGHDDPGNFNYHLKRLLGNLVEKTETGYRLSDVGQHFIGVLLSGRFDPGAEREFSNHETTCLVCGDQTTARYEDGLLRAKCVNGHEAQFNAGYELVENRSIHEVLNVATVRTLFESKLAFEGICPFCEGQTSIEMSQVPDGPIPVQYEARCSRCGGFLQNSPGGCVIFHPAVISFCYEHGVDVFQRTREVMTGHLDSALSSDSEPAQVEVTVSAETDKIVLTLDDSSSVIELMESDR